MGLKEYLECLPGIEGPDGVEWVPTDLNDGAGFEPGSFVSAAACGGVLESPSAKTIFL